LRLTLGQAEVEEDDLAGASQFQVLGLDISVNDGRPMRMQILQRIEQLIGPLQYLIAIKRPASEFQLCGEVITGDELHDKELAIAFDEVIADSGESDVMEAGEQSGFALEGARQLFVAEEGLLERDRRSQAEVDCLVDRAHPAVADHSYDPVSILQDCGRREHKAASESFTLIDDRLAPAHDDQCNMPSFSGTTSLGSSFGNRAIIPPCMAARTRKSAIHVST
jgi:hypothetical protein